MSGIAAQRGLRIEFNAFVHRHEIAWELGMAALAVLVAVVASGCGGSTPAEDSPILPFVGPTAGPTAAAPTPLPVESRGGGTVGTFYKPPRWDGVSDVNCSDFDTHAHAQSFFAGTNGSKTNDPYGLDGDHDGNPCETLP